MLNILDVIIQCGNCAPFDSKFRAVIVACSCVKIDEYVSFPYAAKKIIQRKALKLRYLRVTVEIFTALFFNVSKNVETISEFNACLVVQIIEAPVRHIIFIVFRQGSSPFRKVIVYA